MALHEGYIHPFTGFGFKRFFGTPEHKDLLISFLNALLQGKEVIKDLTFLDTDSLSAEECSRLCVYDVRCETEQGERLLVEIQLGDVALFQARSVYYSTYPIRQQAPQGLWDGDLKGIYIVGILDFVYSMADANQYLHEVKLVDLDSQEVFLDKLTYLYVEMPKFKKTVDELETMLDKWLFALNTMANSLGRPEIVQEAFRRLTEMKD